MASPTQEHRDALAHEHGYESLWKQTRGRREAKEFLEQRGETYSASKADELNRFRRDHVAGTMTRTEMRQWYEDNINEDVDDDEFYDWLDEWTDSGEAA